MKNKLQKIENSQLIEYPKIDSDGTDEVISVEKKGLGHMLAQNTSDLIFRIEIKPVRKITYITPSCLRISGYTQEEFYADYELLLRLVHPDDVDLINRFRNIDARSTMLRWIRKDGAVIWTEHFKTVTRDEKGEPVSLYIVVRDITQRLKARLELEAMEEKFVKTFQASPHPICIIDLENDTFLDVNEGFTRFTGYPRQEVIGHTSLDLNLWVRKEDMANMKSILAKDGRMHNREFSIWIKSGEIRSGLFSAEFVAIAGKLCMVLVITDITGQKRLEAARRESEEKYKAIFNNVNAVIVWLDNNGYLIEANAKSDDFFGNAREDIVGKHFSQLGVFNPKELPRLREMFLDAMAGKVNGYVDDLEALNKKGEKLFINMYSDVVKKDGEITGVICILHDITTQKKAEEARHESEEKYKTIFDNITDVVVRINRFGRITEINSRVEEIYGFKREELLGKRFTKLGVVTVKDLPKLVNVFGNAIQGKQNFYQEELETRDKSGKPIFIDAKFTVVKKNGKVEGIVALVSNITERKKAEHALKKSEDKFAKIFSSSPNPICITALDGGNFIDVNESFLHFTGYSREEIIGHNAADLNLWVGDDNPIKLRKTLFEAGSLCNYEINSRRKSGELRTGLFSGNLIEIDGKLCMALVITDITEQKWAEEALRESEEFTSSLLKNNPTPIFVAYPDSSIKYVNPAFEKLTGYSLTDVIGAQTPYPWWPEESRKEITEQLHETKFGANTKKEMAYRKKNGERFWVELNASQVTQNGDKKYLLINWVDITERKTIELALRESEEKFSKAFNASPDCMAIMRMDDGKYIEVNDTFTSVTGYSRNYILGKSINSIQKWDEADSQKIILEKLGTDGRVVKEECSFRTKSGEIKTMWYSAELLKIGGVDCALSITTDITERKRAEKELQESQEKFSKAFSSASDAMAIFSSQGGNFLEVNDNYVRISGYSRDELVGRNADNLNMWGKPEDRVKILHLLGSEHRVQHEEFAFCTKSGEIRTCLFSAESIKVSGEPRIIVSVQDITERKQMENALRDSEEKFSKAFSSSGNAICISSLSDNKYIEVNDSFTRFTGYSREEVLGHTSAELNLWTDGKELLRFANLLKKDGKFHNFEMHSRAKSREIRVGLASAENINIGGVPCRIVVITDITERKQMEMALRESEEKFSKAFNSSANAICITDMKNRCFMVANDAFCRFTGYSMDEVIGHNATELNLWIKEEEKKQSLEEIGKDGIRIYNREFSSRMKSGEIRVGLSSVENIYIGGEPFRMVVITDITERKKAEERSRLLGSVTQQVTDSIIVTDPSFRITYMNKAAQNLYGYSLEELMGKQMATVNAAPSEKQRKEIAVMVSKGKTWSGIIVKKRKDGSTFLCDCHLSPMYDEKGGITSNIVVNRDITEQKRIEAEIKGQKQLIENILSSMPEGVLVLDSADRVMLANESFRKIFHTSRKTLEGRSLNLIIKVAQLFDLYTSIRNGQTESQSMEFRYKYQSQEKIIVCAIIKMDNDRMLLIFSDVSREREEEDKLYLTDRLASLGQMAAGLAHELNNPLTGILTLSHLLSNSDISEEHKEDLRCVYSEAKRAASIVKNVLLFTRNNTYENGKSSVNEVVKEIFRLREHEETVNNIKVVTNLQENLAEVALDKYQLQQVFLNIILNAEAAIQEAKHPGTIMVTTERVNHHVTIKFTDNGCGIKKQVLPRIFDPFFTTKDIGKGTGLGLSICYGIIVKHNGKISVKTQVGKGTTFTVKIPIATGNETAITSKGA